MALILTQVSSAIEIQNGFNSNGKNYMALSVSEKIVLSILPQEIVMEEVKGKDDRMVSLLVNKKISPLLTALTVYKEGRLTNSCYS